MLAVLLIVYHVLLLQRAHNVMVGIYFKVGAHAPAHHARLANISQHLHITAHSAQLVALHVHLQVPAQSVKMDIIYYKICVLLVSLIAHHALVQVPA